MMMKQFLQKQISIPLIHCLLSMGCTLLVKRKSLHWTEAFAVSFPDDYWKGFTLKLLLDGQKIVNYQGCINLSTRHSSVTNSVSFFLPPRHIERKTVKPTSFFSDLKATHEEALSLKTPNPPQVHYNAIKGGPMQQAKQEKDTISMTQPALSGVSTKLHAHLLPAGHRQKPSVTNPAALSVNQRTRFHRKKRCIGQN